MSDEAHFHLSGYVNKQNCRFWGTENPRICHEEPLHSLKVTVWCGVYAGKVIGPYFFEDDVGNTVSVNGERYRAMVNEFLLPQLDELGLENMWFQQDGATTHTARATIDLLKQAFPGRLISRFGDIHFSARSPDLTVPDFFLWDF
uniref:Transposase n=1 Tax=Cacopsylla melanoneura TaxID=428564 RepID=A0A8D9EM93_9HEMI